MSEAQPPPSSSAPPASPDPAESEDPADQEDPSSSAPPTTPGSADEAAGVVADAVSLVEGAADYIADLLRLEGHRLETQARRLLRRLWVLAAAGAVALLGLFFISLGVAAWVSTFLGSPAAGLAFVGAVYLIIGGLIALVVSRRRVAPPEDRSNLPGSSVPREDSRETG